jgi:endonuclease III
MAEQSTDSTNAGRSKDRVAPLRGNAKRQLFELDRMLQGTYGAPEGALGNKRNPLNEAIYILLSYQTNLRKSKLVWRQLRSSIPRWEDVERAPVGRVAAILRQGGLHRQKARVIKALLGKVRKAFGELSLTALREESDERAEHTLTQLPGLSWKGARCVLLYSLDRDVFPVDVNTFRILKRIGIIAADSVYRRKSLHDRLQEAIPPLRRRQFHVNLVIHGQRTCLPLNPKCTACAVRPICNMTGLRASIEY